MHYLKSLGYLLLFCVLCGCEEKQELRLATAGKGATFYEIGQSLATSTHELPHLHLRVLQADSLNSYINSRMLLRGEADLAIAHNDTPVEQRDTALAERYQDELRTVLPLYPEVCFIIYPDSLEPGSLRELIVGRRIGVGPRTSGSARFMRILFQNYGIGPEEYTAVYTDFSGDTLGPAIDVSCTLTGFNDPQIRRQLMEKNGRLFSLDDYQLQNLGSSVEGFCMNYPRAHAFTIPRNTYGNLPRKPVLTVAVDAVLLTHRRTDPYLISELVRGIVHNQPALIAQNHLLEHLSLDFDPRFLHFKLHEGTRRFLERDEPSFLERYAEVISVGFTVLILGAGGVTSLRRWNKQRKKDRIDTYYRRLMKLENKVENLQTPAACNELMEHVRDIRREAFDLLIAERLTADESFRIFVTYSNDLIESILRKKHSLGGSHPPPETPA